MTAATRGFAKDVEDAVGPWSPELVLVSPELREIALRELTLPHERNGSTVHSELLAFARARPVEHPSPAPQPPLLRVAAAAAARATVLAALFVLAVAGAAFGLTIAPRETEPKLAQPVSTSDVSPQVSSPGIGSAVVHNVTPRRSGPTIPLSRRPRNSIGPTLRLSKRKAAPLLQGGANPVKLRARYISCGPGRWIAAGARFALVCERERPPHRP